jgi:hypothetical protein
LARKRALSAGSDQCAAADSLGSASKRELRARAESRLRIA